MRNVWWIAMTAVALAVGGNDGWAQEPANHPAPAAPEGLPPPTQGATLAPYGSPLHGQYSNGCNSDSACASGRCSTGGCSTCNCGQECGMRQQRVARILDSAIGCSSCNSCKECGQRQQKVARIIDWLTYIPLDRGKTKCCGPCDSCPPPAWAFFPCEGGGRCNTCVASAATVYYAKAPGATTSSQVVQTAYPPQPTPKAAPQPPRVSTYSPQTVNAKMPALDPAQFRKAMGN
jgi:hypothetical protein